ncbi:GTPase-activating Rap/Ran-GAP domain-like protein 3 isoform X1 [Lates japonicus]|uniref:GTPase-activating Rap/Ran-GAP domain-like protein 3 isoform X1 n=1 Tax=Lates japonicus TaxID=270547 RepID=A0AAD3NEN0_LATJO|nr:GTPase-activating Rap/Ran-GAP domain-like protein 3 isoform X1 [Lates japonicus]
MGSESFDKFLNLLGDAITLQGWAGYRGGLDTKNDTTGIKSIYTVYQGHELMFHVSTMLPYSKENKQQVERKRHIGNDIVTIVFQEGDDASSSFKPSMIRSHFTHIFALVRYNSQNDSYSVEIGVSPTTGSQTVVQHGQEHLAFFTPSRGRKYGAARASRGDFNTCRRNRNERISAHGIWIQTEHKAS